MTDPGAAPASVETQLALLNQKVDLLLAATNERGKDHEARLRKLEQFKWVLLGVCAASGPAYAAVSNAFGAN